MVNIFSQDLDPRKANYQPLSPVQFLERSAMLYPDKVAMVHGSERTSYADFYSNVRRLASSLESLGVGSGNTVSVLAPNIPAFLEANFAVPMIAAVLNCLNTRLDANTIGFYP